MELPVVSDDELHEVERSFHRALSARSLDGLNVVGYGEIGIAIAAPADAPRAVVKRMAASRNATMVTAYNDRIRAYADDLVGHVRVLPTDRRIIVDADGWTVPYMVQPLLDPSVLCENLLAEADPEADHPILVAIRETAASVGAEPSIGLDSQISNFAWIDDELVLIDIGSPVTFGPDGTPDIDIGPYERAVPKLMNPVVKRAIVDLSKRMGDTREGLRHASTGLLRLDLDRWLEPALATFNQVLDEPLDAADIRAGYAGIQRELKLIKYPARLQRAWLTRVRRQPYDFFITDSFTKEIL